MTSKQQEIEIVRFRQIKFLYVQWQLFLLLGSFPADDEEVSQDLIRACAFVKPSKWDEFGLSLGVSLADINEIGESTNSHISRMFRVLESWRLAKWPTVGQLLAKFETFRVNRQAIESEFKKLQ